MSPQILVSNLGATVEPGTYISFFLENKLVHGRIVTSFICDIGHNDIMVSVKQFLTSDEVNNMVRDSLLPIAISSQFVVVKELFQSIIFHDIPVGHIHSVIFVRSWN